MTETPTINPRATLQRAICEALIERGPMTVADLAKHLVRTSNNIWQTIRALRRKKLVHAKAWKCGGPGARGGPRGVFVYGPGEDAPKPKGVARERQHRRRYKSRGRRLNIEELGMAPDNIWKGLLR